LLLEAVIGEPGVVREVLVLERDKKPVRTRWKKPPGPVAELECVDIRPRGSGSSVIIPWWVLSPVMLVKWHDAELREEVELL
jgi:hypothetical protein